MNKILAALLASDAEKIRAGTMEMLSPEETEAFFKRDIPELRNALQARKNASKQEVPQL